MIETLRTIINKLDESFNEKDLLKYDLTFESGYNTFGYSILDIEKNKFIGLGFYRNSISGVMNSLPWLTGHFHSVKGIVANSRFTLIPEALYLENEKENYFNFVHERDSGEVVHSDRLQHLGVYSVYGVPAHFSKEIDKFFSQAILRHISSVLISNIWMNVKNMSGRKAFLNLRDAQFDLLVFEGNQLKYCNVFAFEQLSLNPEEVSLVLMGNGDRFSPVYDLLFRYIRNIEFASRNEGLNYSYLFNDIPEHAYFTLLNQT
jgi:hypothetical protein